MATIGLIGCGAWAITVSELFARNGHEVLVWCHDDDFANQINTRHSHPFFFPELELSSLIRATTRLEDVFQDVSALVLGVASPYLDILKQSMAYYSKSIPMLILTKGVIEDASSPFVSDYVLDILGSDSPIAMLSGPNLASEIRQGLPAATVIASSFSEVAITFQSLLSSNMFRVYSSQDIRGVECGGVFKNIIAIAGGAVSGLGFGDNAKAALVSRGLREMVCFSLAFGAEEKTLYGLSGLGDLIATCSSSQSRNYRVGYALTQSDDVEKAKAVCYPQVAEGVKTTRLAFSVAKERGLDLPITQALYNVLFHGHPIKDVMSYLMARQLKPEY